MLADPDSIPDAIERIARRTPVTSGLSADKWRDVPLALRDRALFSAKVENLRVVQSIQDRMLAAVRDARVTRESPDGAPVDVLMTKSRFVREMRRIVEEEGLGPTGPRTIEDIRQSPRLGLIFDMAEKSAYGHAQRKVGLDENVLNMFPAQRLVRVAARREPRDWMTRWQEAGAAVGWEGAIPGDMVALKTSPIWEELSVFGVPWPPFDYGSGMGLRDVRRDEAEALGLVEPGERLAGDEAEERFNAELEASVRDLDPVKRELLKGAFGDQVKIVGGRAAWYPQAYREYYERANDSPQWNPDPFRIGAATPEAVRAASQARGTGRLELAGRDIRSPAGLLRHADDSHGPKSRETPKNIPMTPEDFERVPRICRFPRGAEYDGVKRTVTLRGEAPDGNIIRVVLKEGDGQTAVVQSVYKRKT